jgi:tRNA-specific 2-thiouridylase
MKNLGKKVFVGLSGGVDSSVSALLLKNAGYDVTGVFIKGWQPDWIPCTWKVDRVSAMRTAAYLDIPFITLDLEKQYKDKVVSYLLLEYSKGNTPNPDMLCNREIKFGSFLSWAVKNGADYVATGHYSKIIDGDLYEGNDKEKDQSYFLSQLTETELKRIIFPVGGMQKSEVREIAKENNLPVATRKDSQGICFVGDLSMKEFLTKELNPKKGEVLNTNGDVIGEHDGSILYTIGERHGFTISGADKETRSMFVVSKDIDSNTIVVGDKQKELDSLCKSFNIKDVSLTKNVNLSKIKNLSVRLRYRAEKINCKVSEDTTLVNLSKETIVAPGQFAVFYEGEKCLGGGVIV